MRLWQASAVAFFAYVILVAVIRPTRDAAWALAGAAAGLALASGSLLIDSGSPLLTWLLPPLVLLAAYWASGFLFVAPDARQEDALAWLDERWQLADAGRQIPRALAELLEAAYCGIYPLIPLALLIHLKFASPPDAGRFWSVILLTDFICFSALPWVQTRPPRARETGEPWSSSIRAFNLRLLGATSIQVNTFPSGHAAEAAAAALLTFGAPAWIVAFMCVAALAVAAGAVLGRYHYFVDALAGWAVAVAVYALVR
jgi:membrane-associated phospholipid phosphatase